MIKLNFRTFSGFLDNVFIAASVKFTPLLMDQMGLDGIFYLYTGVSVFTLIFRFVKWEKMSSFDLVVRRALKKYPFLFSYFFMPETFGLSMDEICQIYRSDSASEADMDEMFNARMRRKQSQASSSVLSFYEPTKARC